MTKVSATVTIDAPSAKVWEVLADFGGVYKWAPSVVTSYSTSESNGGPDASRHCDISGFGSLEEFVTQWQEGVGFSYRVTPVGPIGDSFATWRVTPQGGRTRVYVEFEYGMRFGPIGTLLKKLMVHRKMTKGARESLAALKHFVETGEAVDTDTELPEIAAVTA